MERSQGRPPDREGKDDGVAYRLWLPPDGLATRAANGLAPGVVIVHGAGSRKENHRDFAQIATSAGWGALAFDLPGHGSSEPEMSGDAVASVLGMVRLLGDQEGIHSRQVAGRGSSLAGFLGLQAAAADESGAGVIAICPADERDLVRGVRSGRLGMRIGDTFGLQAWLTAQDSGAAVER